jgi:putative transcriptional regulator
MNRASLLGKLEDVLTTHRFLISERYDVGNSCFDLAARKGSKLLLLKATTDISYVDKETASELDRISAALAATPMIIGEFKSGRMMEEDVAYKRYNTFAVTARTLLSMVKDGVLPIAEADVGGSFVYINGQVVKERREKLNLSRGKLASILGISRKALYSYENGSAKCTIGTALRLERVLGAPVVKHVDPFRRSSGEYRWCHADFSKLGTLARKVLSKLRSLKLLVTLARKAPFDFIAKDLKGNKVLGGIARSCESEERRIRVMYSVGRVAMVPAVLISKDGAGGKGVITLEELEQFKAPEDFLSSVVS